MNKVRFALLMNKTFSKPTSQSYCDSLFYMAIFDWRNIYLLLRKTTINTKRRFFQNKILNPVLYLNEILFRLGKLKLLFALFVSHLFV